MQSEWLSVCRLVKCIFILLSDVSSEREGGLLDPLDVVAREGAKVAGAVARTNVPPVVALFHHENRVSFPQLKLVLILRLVVVQGPVPANKNIKNYLSYFKKHFFES